MMSSMYYLEGAYDPFFHRRWVEALRTEYSSKQGRKSLRPNADHFCCLGVACDINDPSLWKDPVDSGYGEFDYLGHSGTLPTAVIEKYGVFQGGLPHLNDSGWTFEEIADAIEVMIP